MFIVGDGRFEVCDGAQGVCDDGICDLGTHQTRKLRNRLIRVRIVPQWKRTNSIYGDNLEVLRQHVKDESVDLIYLDPPFNSRQDYNVLFAEKDGTRSSSQIMAFEDTWEWNVDAERAYEEIVERGGRVSEAMRAFRTFLGHSDMMAYLAMMAPRLIELHRVLKVTGRTPSRSKVRCR